MGARTMLPIMIRMFRVNQISGRRQMSRSSMSTSPSFWAISSQFPGRHRVDVTRLGVVGLLEVAKLACDQVVPTAHPRLHRLAWSPRSSPRFDQSLEPRIVPGVLDMLDHFHADHCIEPAFVFDGEPCSFGGSLKSSCTKGMVPARKFEASLSTATTAYPKSVNRIDSAPCPAPRSNTGALGEQVLQSNGQFRMQVRVGLHQDALVSFGLRAAEPDQRSKEALEHDSRVTFLGELVSTRQR